MKKNVFIFLIFILFLFGSCNLFKKVRTSKKITAELVIDSVLSHTNEITTYSSRFNFRINAPANPGLNFTGQLKYEKGGRFYMTANIYFLTFMKVLVDADTVLMYLPMQNAFIKRSRDTLAQTRTFASLLNAVILGRFIDLDTISIYDYKFTANKGEDFIFYYEKTNRINAKYKDFYVRVVVSRDFYIKRYEIVDNITPFELYMDFDKYKTVEYKKRTFLLPSDFTFTMISGDTTVAYLSMRNFSINKPLKIKLKIPKNAKPIDHISLDGTY